MGFWIQTGALILSAIFALLLVQSRERSEKRRATVDLVVQQKHDSQLQASRQWLLTQHENHAGNFTQHLGNKTADPFRHILNVLNNYEFIATGIREDALDQEIYKRLQYSVAIKDWDAYQVALWNSDKALATVHSFRSFRHSLNGGTKNLLKPITHRDLKSPTTIELYS